MSAENFNQPIGDHELSVRDRAQEVSPGIYTTGMQTRSRRLGKLVQHSVERDIVAGPSQDESESRSRRLGKIDQQRGMQFHDMAEFAIAGVETEVE